MQQQYTIRNINYIIQHALRLAVIDKTSLRYGLQGDIPVLQQADAVSNHSILNQLPWIKLCEIAIAGLNN